MKHNERFDPAVEIRIDDFIDEALDILTDLCRYCGELRQGAPVDEVSTTIALGLHTIKGNAQSVGFSDFSYVAARLLKLIQSSCRQPTEDRSAEVVALILEFVTSSRQFLVLVREGETKPSGFFDQILRTLDDYTVESGGEVDQESFPSQRESVSDDAKKNAEEELTDIVVEAPPVNPNLNQLSRVAAQPLGLKAARKSSESVLDPENPPGRACENTPRERTGTTLKTQYKSGGQDEILAGVPIVDERRRETLSTEGRASTTPQEMPQSLSRGAAQARLKSSLLSGFALEAITLGKELDDISERLGEHSGIAPPLAAVREFVARFSGWALDSRPAAISDYLDGCAEELKKESAVDLSIELAHSGVSVFPLVGEFVRDTVLKLLRGLSVAHKEQGNARFSCTVDASEHKDGLTVKLTGVSFPQGPAARLRVYPLRARLEALGGGISVSENSRSVVVEIPRLLQLEVLVVQAGCDYVGIPKHRVAEVSEIDRSKLVCTSSACSYEHAGQLVSMLDLTGAILSNSGSREDVECRLIHLHSDAKRQGLLVDSVIESQEMMMLPQVRGRDGGDILGFAFSVKEQKRIPVLSCQLI